MGKPLVLFPLLLGVFVFGFVAGVAWQRSEAPSVVAEPVISAEYRLNNAETLDVSEAETRINKALEDPDFKRVHDLLSRENPIQMNIPPRETAPEKPIPMSERPAVKFSVDKP